MLIDTNYPSWSFQFYKDIEKEVSMLREYPKRCAVCGRQSKDLVTGADYAKYCPLCYKRHKKVVYQDFKRSD